MRIALVVAVMLFAAPAAALPLPALHMCDSGDDAGQGVDASESRPLTVGQGDYDGCIDDDDADHTEGYLITTTGDEKLGVTFRWSGSCFAYVSILFVHEDGSQEFVRGLGGTICREYSIHSDKGVPGTYLVLFELRDPSNRGTPYTMHVAVGEDVAGSCGAQDDADSGGDAPIRGIVPLASGRGCVDEWDWEDTYTFSLSEPTRVLLTLESSDPCWVVEGIILPHGSRDWWDGWWYDAWDCETRTWGFELPAGDYDIIHMPIMTSHPQAIRYDLDLRAVTHGSCGVQDDGGLGRDATIDDRAPIAFGQTLSGCLDEFDQRDVYALDVKAGDTFRVNVASVDGCHAPFLRAAPEGNPPSWSSKSGCAYTRAYRATQAGTWDLELLAFGTLDRDYGTYTIGVERCRGGGVLQLLSPSDACNVGDTIASMSAPPTSADLPVSHRFVPR